MKKSILPALLLFLANTCLGQALSSYNFNAFTCHYDSLTTSFMTPSGGTTIGGGGPFDDCYYNSIPIGFNFVYCGTTYNSVSASANCWITLGQILPFTLTTYANTFDADLPNTAAVQNLPRPIIAALWIDQVTNAPNVRYQTTGTSPNRIFTIEWSKCGFFNYSFVYPPHISVEIKLYESSNIIDFAYYFIAPGSSNTGYEAIGITDGSGAYPVTGTQSYWSLNNAGSAPVPSMTTFTQSIATLPATDQVYRWSYQCAGKPDAGTVIPTMVSACSSFSSKLSLDCSSSIGAGITYQWQSSPDSLTWTSVSGATADTYATTVSATVYYRCKITCTTSGLTDSTAGVKLSLYTPPTSITGTKVVCVGATTTLSDATPGGSWSSGATTIATVGSGTGVVTGVSAGTAVISYKFPTGCYSVATVTVNAMPSTIGGTKTVCTGSTTTLTNTLSGGTWTSSNTAVAGIGTSGVVTGIAPGTTTITYSKGTGAICFVITTVTVNLSPAPITGTLIVCAGSTTALSDATGGGVWSSANTGVATINPTTGVLTGISGGTAIISYTLAGGCAAIATVTVNPLPSSVTGITSVCAGQTNPLFGSGGGTWSSGNTTIATIGITSGIVTGISPGTSIITYTLPTGCFTTVVMVVNPSPGAITGVTSVCVGGNSTLSNATTGGTWSSFNPGIASINITTGLLTGVSGGTTTITYMIGFGCYATTTVTVYPLPATIAGVLRVCAGSTTALSNAVPGGVWTSGNTSVATVGSLTGVVSGITPGTSSITYSLGTGCSTVSTVTVNPLPSAIAGPTNVCTGSTISLTDPTAGGIWTSSNTTLATVSATGLVTGISAGTATITYKIFSTGCMATTTVTVNTTPGAITGITGMCIGTTSTLSNIVGGGTWTSGNTTIATVGYTTGVVTGMAAGTASITYSLGGGCNAITTVTIYPSTATILGTPTMCAGSSTTLTGPGAGTWSSGASMIATVGSSSGVVSGIAAGTAVITYSVFLTGCMATTVVTVYPLPAVTGSTSVCIGSTVVLSSSPSGGTWSSSNTGIASVGSSSGIVAGISSGTTTITFKLSGTGCSITTVVTVTPPSPAITGTTGVCIGNTTTLSNPIAGGSWLSSTTTIATIGNTTGIATGMAAGTATITYIPPVGCPVTTTVTVYPFPVAISGITSVCSGATITLSSPGGGTWSSSATPIATVGSGSGIVTGGSIGTAVITYKLPTGCTTTASVAVTPAPGAIGGATTLCMGATSTLTNTVSGGLWTSSNTSVASVGSVSGIVSGLVAGTASITYSLGAGCSVSTVVTVSTGPAPIAGITTICVGSTTTLSSVTTGGAWSSSNTAVAPIGLTSGIATGSAVGTATITYTKGCITLTTVTVTTAPATISGPAGVCQGGTASLTNSVTGGTWTSSNTLVAAVGYTSGLVAGLSTGTSTITYSLGSGCSVTKTITVNAISPITGATSICNGSSSALSCATPGGVWSGTPSTVCTIGATTGIITGVAPGMFTCTYMVTATGCFSTATVTVNSSPGPITGAMTICSGQTTALTNTVTGGTWTSSNTSVATIGFTSGLALGISPGTSSITYSLGSACKVVATITVNPSSSVITGAGNVCTGSLITLSNGSVGGSWSSSNTAVATIGITSGILSGVMPGTATITYSLPAGCSATKTITIIATPAPITAGASLCVGQATTLTSTTTGGTWSGASTTVATIGLTSGTVAGLSPGVFTAVYTVSGCSVSGTVTVVPTPTLITGAASVCVGQVALLSNGVSGGTWTSGNTGIAAIGATSGAASGLASGTVLISYALGSGCVAFTTINVNPISPITGSNTVCTGQATLLIDTTLGGLWSSSNTTIATVGAGKGIVTGVKTGVVTIIYTTSKGCTATHTMTVLPTPPAIAGRLSVCSGLTTALTNTSTGGTWTSSNTSIATITTSGVVTGLNAGTAIITYSLGGCPAVATITVNPLPAAITGPTDVCVASVITLFSSGGGTWSSSSMSVASVGSVSGIVKGLTPGTTTVSYTLTTGCAANAIINVNPLPAPVTGPSNVCISGTTALSDATPGGAWSGSPSTVAYVDPMTGVVTGLGTGIFTCYYTLVTTGCTASLNMVVNAAPPAITGPTNVCVGATIMLSNPVAGGTWSSGSTAIASVDPVTGMVSGIAAGTVNIDYTNGSGCAASTAITVDPPPAAITGFNQVCVGYTTMLFNTTLPGTWSSTSTITATIDPFGVVTGNTPGTAIISYTLSTGCAATVVVSVSPIPSAISGVTNVCLGSSYTFSNTLAGGTWASTNSAIATAGLTSGIITGVSTGPATIIYTLGAGCSATLAINVVPLPAVFSVTGGGSFCSGGLGKTIGLSSSVVGTNYFLFKGGKIATGPLPGTGAPIDFGLQAIGGTYTVIATNNLTGCSNTMSGSVMITVIPSVIPSVSISSVSGDTICSGATATFTATATNGGSSPIFKWDVNGTVVGASTSYKFIPANGDIVTCTLTSDAACALPPVVSSSDTVKVVLPVTPSASLSTYPGDTICEGQPITITPVPSFGGSAPKYTWMKNGASAGSGPTFTYVPTKGDHVYCKMTSNYQCLVTKIISSNMLAITVDSPLIPHIAIKANPGASIAAGETVTFTADVTNGGTNPAYQWYFNSLPVKGATTKTYVTSGFSSANDDSVSCTVTSSGLCSMSTHQWVYISVHELVVNHNFAGSGISVLPNPNKGEFIIKGYLGFTDGHEVALEITDLLGQSVYKNTMEVLNGNINKQVLLSNTLANGMYILTVRSAGGKYVFHLVVEQ